MEREAGGKWVGGGESPAQAWLPLRKGPAQPAQRLAASSPSLTLEGHPGPPALGRGSPLQGSRDSISDHTGNWPRGFLDHGGAT